MKLRLAFALLLITAGPLARSQAAPAATSGGAGLRYVLRYSETAQFAQKLGTWHTINTSGSLNYADGRSRSPFNLDYTGGYISTLSGPPYSTGPFHHLLVSQGLYWRKWFMNFSDDVGYRRQAPITGLSGIPGTGEPIAGGTNPVSSEFILTVNTPVVSNDASGELRHIVNHSVSISVDAHHSLLRFVNGRGLDTDQLKIGAGPSFRLDARNSLIAQYEFSRFTYPDYDVQFQTHAVTFGYDKIWNRAFQSVVSAGPELVQATATIPGSLGVAMQASLTYQARHYSANLSYDRGTTGGSGYLVGAKTDSVRAGLSRSLTKQFTVQMSGGYRRTSDLASTAVIAGEIGGLQASWRMGRYLNAFANYTVTSQSSTAQVPSNVLTEIMQLFSFGINFSKAIKSAR